MSIRNLDFLFRPRSIAVIGASEREHSVGTTVMRNLLDGGFRGPIFPVHHKRQSVAGVHAYRDVAFLPQVPDLAVVCTPRDTIPGLVGLLGAQGVRAVAILTDGVQHELVLEAARQRLTRVLGPNSMGIIAAGLRLNASFAPTPASPGPLAIVSQSGALLAAALDWAATRGIGFTYAVSLGDAADVDAGDVLDYLGDDPSTGGILLYVESVRSGRKFLSAARAAARAKPVIVMKAGRTPAGAELARRHTEADPGADDAFDAAVSRAGMVRVHSIAELFEAAQAIGRMSIAADAKLAILTNAGGPAVIAADALLGGGGEVASTPVDLGGDADPGRYASALREALARSPRDPLLLIHGPTGVTTPEEVAEACSGEARDSGRVLACWLGGERARSGAATLRAAGIAVYDMPEGAARAFLHMRAHQRNQEALQESPASADAGFEADTGAAETVIARALDAGRERLTDPEGKALLVAYGVPIVHVHVAADANEAARLATEIGYPVALKVLSPDLVHRSEVGGVMVNLESEAELRDAALAIAGRMRDLRPEARLEGFTVQRMIRPPGAMHRRHGARELTLRAQGDRAFGMLMRLDGAVGIVPLNETLARDMLPRDAQAAAATAVLLSRVSRLIARHPQVVELEIDPILVDAHDAMALEVRVRVARTRLAPGEHLAIRPYPSELESRIDVRGSSILLRPIRPGDGHAYAEFIARTEAPDLKFRFFSRTRRVSARELARFTQIDYDREMAFVAVLPGEPGSPEILGEMRIMFYRDGDSAEFAILVRSDQKRRGVGRALMEKVIDYARSRGKHSLIGQIDPANEAMIALARRSGMEVEMAPGSNLAVAHLDLRPAPPQVRLF